MTRRVLLLTAALALLAGLVPRLHADAASTVKRPVARVVPLSITVLDTGPLSVPWDVVFAPDGTMLFDQRSGGITARPPGEAQRSLTTPADFSDLFPYAEAGLLGMAVDPAFTANRRFYTCEDVYDGSSVLLQVRRWTVDAGWTRATRDGTILADAPGGVIHTGCRLLFDRQGQLLVSIGDNATGTAPEDPRSLAGKVLRIDTAGRPSRGNPGLGGDPRVLTLGHRNPQGLALQPNSNRVWETEHGPAQDDEVNLLAPGGDYGWNPVGENGAYDQSVPMTRPGALPAAYSTGPFTRALAGATFLTHPRWGRMRNELVVASLSGGFDTTGRAGGQRLLVFARKGTTLSAPAFPPELLGTYGRLRAVREGPDGALYVTTANGADGNGVGQDRILRVVPAP